MLITFDTFWNNLIMIKHEQLFHFFHLKIIFLDETTPYNITQKMIKNK